MRRDNATTIIDLKAAGLARHLPPGRTLHLVDVENLAGGSGVSDAQLLLAAARYDTVAPMRAGDHRVVACGRRLAYAAKARWPEALVRAARGIDGADLLLLDEANVEYVRRRYASVVIGSGDHIFTDVVIELDRVGVGVAVVSRPESLSRLLREAAPVTWFIDSAGLRTSMPAAVGA